MATSWASQAGQPWSAFLEGWDEYALPTAETLTIGLTESVAILAFGASSVDSTAISFVTGVEVTAGITGSDVLTTALVESALISFAAAVGETIELQFSESCEIVKDYWPQAGAADSAWVKPAETAKIWTKLPETNGTWQPS